MSALNKQLFSPLVIVIIALGILGIAMNFRAALNQVLVVVGVIVVIYFLYKFFTSSNKSSNDKDAYSRAVKQSKQKYAPQKKGPSKSSPADFMQRKASNGHNTNGQSSSKKKRKQTNLTVIDGKKGKKKDNASY